MTEPEGEARRGRPRPQDTIARDDQVLAAVPEDGTGVTRTQLAAATQLAPNAIYLSLYRLQRDKRIERARENGAHVWKRVSTDAT